MRTDIPIHRLLQRHKSGAGGSHILEALLREETGRLAAEIHAVDSERTELRRLAESQLNSFEQKLFRAVDLVAFDPARAYDQLCQADAALRDLRLYQRSIQQLREVEVAWARLHDDLALQPLAELPTLRIPRRLLALSRRFLENHRPRESAVASRLSRRILEQLAALNEATEKAPPSRFEVLRVSLVKAGVPGAERVAEVESLAMNGYKELANRLADDLETELLGWRAQISRGRTSPPAILREISDVARLAASLEQTFRSWLPSKAGPTQQE